LSTNSPEKPVTWRQALAHSVALSLLFMVVYGGASWITSLRTDVGTWYYAWERFIPFVPIMIIPYMSVDLFFVAAPFICSDRRELQLLSKRIRLGILVAGCCFLIYPLKLATERPVIGGWLGVIWSWFIGMDRPFNLLPSLHITLRTILANTYARHTRGLWHVASSIWFSLIGFSTLLMHQHHVVDVIGGFILAAICFYVINDVPLRLPMVRNLRIGWQYAALCACLAILCWLTWPLGAILIWPMITVAIVTAGYFHTGPGIFRKTYGRLPLSARIVLAPVLLGQYVSWLYYKRHCRPWDEVTPGVWIGRRLSDAEALDAVNAGVTAVLDLSDAFSEARPFIALGYCHIPVLDLTAPTASQLSEAVAFIDAHITSGIVYVHCKIGYSRSAAVVAAWLFHAGHATSVNEAIALLRSRRPTIVIRPEISAALSNFAVATSTTANRNSI
jgi:protein-tyrosine phosphatase/membrane-associated phospholipid phosphatase